MSLPTIPRNNLPIYLQQYDVHILNVDIPECLIGGCQGTEFGCCCDKITTAVDTSGSNCIGGCCGTQFGCCPYSTEAKVDREGTNCGTIAGSVLYTTVGAIPSNVPSKRVWDFNLTGYLKPKIDKYYIVYDFSEVNYQNKKVTFENMLSGTFRICGQVLDASKLLDYKFCDSKLTLTIIIDTKKWDFRIKKEAIFSYQLNVNDTAPVTTVNILKNSNSGEFVEGENFYTWINTVNGDLATLTINCPSVTSITISNSMAIGLTVAYGGNATKTTIIFNQGNTDVAYINFYLNYSFPGQFSYNQQVLTVTGDDYLEFIVQGLVGETKEFLAFNSSSQLISVYATDASGNNKEQYNDMHLKLDYYNNHSIIGVYEYNYSGGIGYLDVYDNQQSSNLLICGAIGEELVVNPAGYTFIGEFQYTVGCAGCSKTYISPVNTNITYSFNNGCGNKQNHYPTTTDTNFNFNFYSEPFQTDYFTYSQQKHTGFLTITTKSTETIMVFYIDGLAGENLNVAWHTSSVKQILVYAGCSNGKYAGNSTNFYYSDSSYINKGSCS